MKKRAFESLSRDFSLFKNVVVSLTNLCQGQLKISRENAKLPRKPRNRKRKYPPKIPPDVTPLAPITCNVGLHTGATKGLMSNMNIVYY